MYTKINNNRYQLTNTKDKEILLDINEGKTITAIKLISLYAGSPHALKINLKRIGLEYVKVNKGAKTSFVVRGKDFERLVVDL